MIYQGLKKHCFYYEFVNITRKTFLVAVNVFMSTFNDIFKTMLSLMVLVFFLRFQQKMRPFKNPVHQYMEEREHITSIFTFYAALFFISPEATHV